MSWVEIDENLYQNDIAPYFLQKIESQWYVVDSRDKSKFISFLDIFSNPVFPSGGTYPDLDFIVKNLIALNNITATNLIQALNITATNLIQALNINTTDLTVSNLIQALNITATNLIQALNINTTDLTVSNLIQALNITATGTIRANHFRGEISNTPNTPSFSSQGDSNTGFYHISDGIFGFSSNGIQQGEFGNGYGGFKGNTLQIISERNTYNYSEVNQTVERDILKAVSTIWIVSLVPKKLNSIFKIIYKIFCSRNNIGGFYLYYRINGGAWVRYYNPSESGSPNDEPVGVRNSYVITTTTIPYSLNDLIEFKITSRQVGATSPNTTQFNYGTTLSGFSQVIIEEFYV